MAMKEYDHGGWFFLDKGCKWDENLHGTKYVVDLIWENLKSMEVDAWIIQSKHAVECKN